MRENFLNTKLGIFVAVMILETPGRYAKDFAAPHAPSLDFSPLVLFVVLVVLAFLSLFSTDMVRLNAALLKPRLKRLPVSGMGSSLSIVTGSSFLILQNKVAQLNWSPL